MDLDRQEQVISKLDSAYPDASDWIFDRAEQISDELLIFSVSKRTQFHKGENQIPSPLSAGFWKAAINGMGRAVTALFKDKDDNQNNKSASKPAKESIFSMVFEGINMVEKSICLAIEEYIENNNVPLDIFNEDELAHIRKYSATPVTKAHSQEPPVIN